MEEKKKVKINISTILLMLALVVIIIMAIYIYKINNEKNGKTDNITEKLTAQENKNDDNFTEELKKLAENGYENKSNESEDATLRDEDDGPQPMDNNIEVQSTSSKTVPQLDGNFYEIKSIIKEYRDNEKVKNYKDFNYDLDSDGTIDKITLKHIINEKEEEYSSDRNYYSLEYNGKPIYDHWDGYGSVGIVDLDSRDKYLDIWVYDDGPSDDPGYCFFRKVGNKIIKMGELGVERSFLCDGKGKILSAHRDMPWISPQVFNCYYTIENNKLKKHTLDFSYNKNFEYTSSTGFFTTDLENLKKFEKDDSKNGNTQELIALGKKYNINKLDKNAKFKVVKFIEAGEYSPMDLEVTLSDGTKGYLIHPYGRFYIYD